MGEKLNEVKTALTRAQENLERWHHQREQRALKLAEAEKRLGESVLEGVPPDARINKESTSDAIATAASHIATLRTERDAAVAAADAAAGVVDKTQREVWLVEAGELRERASERREEAAERQKTTDDLLGQLLQHEGVNYVVEPPPPTELGEGIRFIPTAKTTTIIDEAERLEQQAAVLGAQAADTSERRREQEEERQKAHQEWLDWEHERFRQEELEDAKARGVEIIPNPDVLPAER